MDADLLLTNIGQLVTCGGDSSVRRRDGMRRLQIINDAAVAVRQGTIVGVGTAQQMASASAENTIDCRGCCVIPGFVDCHTHAVYGGDRVDEFELRIGGATYVEIMAAGGGIVSTMRKTRNASVDQLVAQTLPRLDQMLSLGTTTVEIKSGYGLRTEDELKMLRVIEQLDLMHACSIIPTFLGAHTVPPEFSSNGDAYVDLVVAEMIPAVAEWHEQTHFAQQSIPLAIDVFCEEHAFDLDQTGRILRAGMQAGMRAKVHADQFNRLGAVSLAAEIGALSVDHLDVTQPQEARRLAQSETVGVALPAANFNLGGDQYADLRMLIAEGAAVAIATDLNPGSAPCYSMPLTMAIACRYQKLLPAEAMTAATINAAYAAGVGDRAGRIEVGKQADLLILDVDDYRQLSYMLGGNHVQTVIKSGEIVYQRPLNLQKQQ